MNQNFAFKWSSKFFQVFMVKIKSLKKTVKFNKFDRYWKINRNSYKYCILNPFCNRNVRRLFNIVIEILTVFTSLLTKQVKFSIKICIGFILLPSASKIYFFFFGRFVMCKDYNSDRSKRSYYTLFREIAENWETTMGIIIKRRKKNITIIKSI